MSRVLRAPIFFAGLLISAIPAFFIFALVTIGDWCQQAMLRLGWRNFPGWLPFALGVVGYSTLGIAAPAYLGNLLIGWIGAVIAPLIAMVVIARLGKW